MKEKPNITTQEIADKIGISKRAVLKQIANMKEKEVFIVSFFINYKLLLKKQKNGEFFSHPHDKIWI